MKLSVQLYTVRNDMAKDPWGTLSALRKMGLNYVEVGGTYGIPAREFKDGLDKLGLKVSGNHAGIADLENNLDQVIEDNHILENNIVQLAWIGHERYDKGWDLFAKELEPIAKKLNAEGITFGYHNHDFEFKLQNGRPGLDIFFESSDPKLITSQLDTYWCAYGGYDPATYIKKLKGRIPQVHCKDGKLGEGKPHYLEAGKGDLDWDGILAACRESNVDVASIELDESPGEPLDAVRVSAEFLRSKGVSE